MKTIKLLLLAIFFLLNACAVGPTYVRPSTVVPQKYKETSKHWKIAQPQDVSYRGEWWRIFNDAELNALEARVNVSSQTIAAAEAQYRQARALVDQARAGYFPVLANSVSVTRQQQSTSTTIVSSTTSSSGPKLSTSDLLSLNATWEPDLWGNVRRLVESSVATAQATAAMVAGVRLSTQASLAQFYFQLRVLDRSQQLLDDAVHAYQTALKLVKKRRSAGVAALTDVAQAEAQLKFARAQAIDNGIQRAQFEHAIAVLIGQPPATFSLARRPLLAKPPLIPLEVPSALLERRPDIAQAERQMAAANASIGVAIAAYFPVLTLSGTGGYLSNRFAQWISAPALFWSVGAQLATTLFDGGLRSAKIAAARAAYDQSVALYRQTVLAAFQEVEDNLVALRLLNEEMVVQQQGVAAARLALRLVMQNYKQGIVAYTEVIIAQTTFYSAEKTASDIESRRMIAAVNLIKALGGGWRVEG